ncbi:MAG: arylsulfatase [Pirellulales bacterium]
MLMLRNLISSVIGIGLFLASCLGGLLGDRLATSAERATRPNIIVILADDLGYGDVQSFHSKGKISTPHLDRLAAAGMRFTDAHSSSSVCTPTRYALLTGRYNWRSRLKSGVQGGLSPRLIEPNRLTLASLLKSHGYHTACFGKWHLGMDWPQKPNSPPFGDGIEKGPEGWRVDWSKPIANGPTSVGFDEYFGISASLDMVPYTFIHNDRVTVIPTVDKSFAMMLGRDNNETRRGPAAVEFEAEEVLQELTDRTIDYLKRRASAAHNGTPFFVYLPLASPHTPIVPKVAWRGKSGLNHYADFVMETDDAIGRIHSTLDQLKLAANTLIVVTSDNGCSPQADFPALLAKGHDPSGGWRGHKADIFEGGHRVPFIATWPASVPAGAVSTRTIGLFDLFATCAEIVSAPLPRDAGEDSVSFLPTLLGVQDQPPREAIVHHSINGSFAIRQGVWKLALCADSGGWSDPKPNSPTAKQLPAVQLYNLADDASEQRNLAPDMPEKVAELRKLLDRYRDSGRSVP